MSKPKSKTKVVTLERAKAIRAEETENLKRAYYVGLGRRLGSAENILMDIANQLNWVAGQINCPKMKDKLKKHSMGILRLSVEIVREIERVQKIDFQTKM